MLENIAMDHLTDPKSLTLVGLANKVIDLYNDYGADRSIALSSMTIALGHVIGNTIHLKHSNIDKAIEEGAQITKEGIIQFANMAIEDRKMERTA